jgi:adenylate cyclase class 2
MLEIEIKSPTRDYKDILKKISIMGFEFSETRVEEDIYFNHPCRDFYSTDEALRIRKVNSKNILTYKGPKLGARAKSRVEQEVLVENLETMTEILLSLGFVVSGQVTKTRSIYSMDEVEITIDRVENLGDYVEIEKKGEDREAIENELFGLAGELGLKNFERRSYLEMILGVHEPD